MEKEKKSEEDTHKIEIKEMECKVKQIEQRLEEVLDARNSDELRELQVTVIKPPLFVTSTPTLFKEIPF